MSNERTAMNPPATHTAQPNQPHAWTLLEQALSQRRTIKARYHGAERILCPHALGWKRGRAKVLVYQSAGATTTGALPAATNQRWRSMFVDEIEDPTITDDQWQTADNYTPHTNGIDTLALALPKPGQ
jgi:hypothetical protein